MHKTRQNRKVNQRRKELKKQQCRPIPKEDQERIAQERQQEKNKRYPVPPKYRYHDSDPQPVQHPCYDWSSL